MPADFGIIIDHYLVHSYYWLIDETPWETSNNYKCNLVVLVTPREFTKVLTKTGKYSLIAESLWE